MSAAPDVFQVLVSYLAIARVEKIAIWTRRHVHFWPPSLLQAAPAFIFSRPSSKNTKSKSGKNLSAYLSDEKGTVLSLTYRRPEVDARAPAIGERVGLVDGVLGSLSWVPRNRVRVNRAVAGGH